MCYNKVYKKGKNVKILFTLNNLNRKKVLVQVYMKRTNWRLQVVGNENTLVGLLTAFIPEKYSKAY